MDFGFEIVAAKSKREEEDDQPSSAPMRPMSSIRRNPSTDQKKVRRQMTKKASGNFYLTSVDTGTKFDAVFADWSGNPGLIPEDGFFPVKTMVTGEWFYARPTGRTRRMWGGKDAPTVELWNVENTVQTNADGRPSVVGVRGSRVPGIWVTNPDAFRSLGSLDLDGSVMPRYAASENEFVSEDGVTVGWENPDYDPEAGNATNDDGYDDTVEFSDDWAHTGAFDRHSASKDDEWTFTLPIDDLISGKDSSKEKPSRRRKKRKDNRSEFDKAIDKTFPNWAYTGSIDLRSAITRRAAEVSDFGKTASRRTAADANGNRKAKEGIDRCLCGAKYWENDRCIDCGTSVDEVRKYRKRYSSHKTASYTAYYVSYNGELLDGPFFSTAEAWEVVNQYRQDAGGYDDPLFVWELTVVPVQREASLRTAARPEGWWPIVPNPDRPGENSLVCPICGSPNIAMTGSNLGKDLARGMKYQILTCRNCGYAKRFNMSASAGLSATAYDSDSLDEDDSDEQDGYEQGAYDAMNGSYAPISEGRWDGRFTHSTAGDVSYDWMRGYVKGWSDANGDPSAIDEFSQFLKMSSRKTATRLVNGVRLRVVKPFQLTRMKSTGNWSYQYETRDFAPGEEITYTGSGSGFGSDPAMVFNIRTDGGERWSEEGWGPRILNPDNGYVEVIGASTVSGQHTAGPMFPGAGAQVYYNDAGEPTGWDDAPYEHDPHDAYDDEMYDRGDSKGEAEWEEGYEYGKDDFKYGESRVKKANGEWVWDGAGGWFYVSKNWLNGYRDGWDTAGGSASAIRHITSSRKTAMPAPADMGVKVGDIFYTSWGYDQTNVNFYQVVRLTGAGVEIRPIRSRVVSGDAYNESVVAEPDMFDTRDSLIGGDRKMCRLKSGYQGRPSISLSRDHDAWLWDGTPRHQSGPYGGH